MHDTQSTEIFWTNGVGSFWFQIFAQAIVCHLEPTWKPMKAWWTICSFSLSHTQEFKTIIPISIAPFLQKIHQLPCTLFINPSILSIYIYFNKKIKNKIKINKKYIFQENVKTYYVSDPMISPEFSHHGNQRIKIAYILLQG